jgi:hypothetical protein
LLLTRTRFWLGYCLLIIGFHYTHVHFMMLAEELPGKIQRNLSLPDNLTAFVVRNPEAQVLFADDGQIRMKFGALTKIINARIPRNMTKENFPAFLREYQFTHLFDEQGEWASQFVPGYQFLPTKTKTIYEIRREAARK